MKVISPGGTIGILGGGQLGRMLALVARRMGYHITILDPSPDAPCSQVADQHIIARYDDMEAVLRLGAQSDVITYEFESIDAQALEALEQHGYAIYPNSKVLKISQNRLLEKEFVRDIGIKVADFSRIETVEDVHRAAQEIGFPGFIKTVYGGYDGKGQCAIHNLDDAINALQQLTRRPLIWEKRIEFVKELGIMCVRSQSGKIVTYPVTENIHVENILDTSIIPARVSAQVAAKAQAIAEKIALNINMIGIFCVEMFLLKDDTLLVNEIAPRPHNSGHYTIDACATSQFEQQLRAICGLPAGSSRLLTNAVMVNILGKSDASQLAGVEEALQNDNVFLHLYGKKRAKAKRKMGHFTILDDDLNRALETSNIVRDKFYWK